MSIGIAVRLIPRGVGGDGIPVDRFSSGKYCSRVNKKREAKRGAEEWGEARLLWALVRTTQRVEARIEAALAETGLSLAKLSVLAHLVEAGEPLPLGQLAGRISCVRSNMTQLVDRLESDGLVERVNDPEDRRSVRASITREGRRRQQAGAQIVAAQEAELLKGFSAPEQRQLVTLLSRLSGDEQEAGARSGAANREGGR